MTLLCNISSDDNKCFKAISLIVVWAKKMCIYSGSKVYQLCLCLFLPDSSVPEAGLITDMKLPKGGQGFTLVELIITITVLAIIASIAMPTILGQLARMEAERVKSQLRSSLNLAKAESYIRRQDVLLCLSNTGGRCHRDSDKTLLLFIDNNSNNHFDVQGDFLLSQQPLRLKYSKLSLRVGSRRHYTKFWGDSGTPRGHFGHIKYCPTATYNQSMYQISFNQTGIVRHKPNKDHPTKCGQ